MSWQFYFIWGGYDVWKQTCHISNPNDYHVLSWQDILKMYIRSIQENVSKRMKNFMAIFWIHIEKYRRVSIQDMYQKRH
jgi:hypothetical protein